MAATFIIGIATNDANAASLTCSAFDSSGGAHVAVFAMAEGTLTTGTPVADNKGNTYVDVGTEYSSSGKRIRCFYAENATCGTGHTITLTPGSSGKLSFTAQVFAGIATSSSKDANGPSGKADVFQTTITPTAAFTPAVDNCAVVTGAYRDSNFTSVSSPFSPADAAPNPSSGNVITACAHVIQTTATSVQPTWTYAAQSTYVGVMVVAFKAAAAGGGNDLSAYPGAPYVRSTGVLN
jgi:hypothetical protein